MVGIVAALTVIVFGALALILVMRRRPSPERLGYQALNEAPPHASRIAERLFAELSHSVFHRRAADQDLYLMFVEAGSSETPDCVVGFAEIGTFRDASDIALLRSERQIPKVLRRLQGGLFTWARPVDPAMASLRPGIGWFWYAADDDPVEDTPAARALARTSRNRGSRKLLGLANLDSQLVVWANVSHIDAVVSHLESLTQDESDSAEVDGL